MVETAVRPRPQFSTFLLSDANAGGDGLSFHDYKRILRSRRVHLLQEKQASSRVPGYKWRPNDYPQGVLQTGVAIEDKSTQTAAGVEKDSEEEEQDKNVHILPPPVTNLTSREIRRLKSGARSATTARVTIKPSCYDHSSRPKTASTAGVRAEETGEDEDSECVWKMGPTMQTSYSSDNNNFAAANDLKQAPNDQVLDTDKLIHSYRWDSSTKRGYNEVAWESKLPPETLYSPSKTSILSLPDPVSLRFVNKRHELYPSPWQSLGNSWDGVQTRSGFTSLNNSFCSPFKNTLHLPGYQGHTSGEPDRTNGDYVSVSLATKQPRPTTVSRRPNIPGYTGCTHWSNDKPALSRLPLPNRYNIDFINSRSAPGEFTLSPFVRTSPLSKMITLVSPFNPFNKIEHQ